MSEWPNGINSALVRHWNPYSAYKPSTVPWMSAVPSHWQVKPLKYICGMNNSVLADAAAPDFEMRYVDIGNVDSLGRILEEQTVLFANAPSRARRRVRDGDTIISTVRTYLKAIAFMDNPPPNRIVSTGFAVLRPYPGIEPKFLWRVVQSAEFVNAVVAHSEGIGYPAINPGQLGSLRVCVPTFEEQRRITAFLDRETAKIDALITKKRRLIELLQEKGTALITHAVTKGLDLGIPMRNSGIEWLGEIPAHWDVKRLFYLTQPARPIMYGIVLPGPDVPEGVPIVKGGDVAPDRLRLDRLNRTTREIESGYSRSRLKEGDIVYAIRGSIGMAELVPCEIEGANLTQDAARVAPKPYLDRKWLLYALKSRPVFAQLDAKATGATIRGINIRDLKRAYMPVPTSREQVQIAQFLESSASRIDALNFKVGKAIDKLREYRTALISAAVTGQIDVREEGRT